MPSARSTTSRSSTPPRRWPPRKEFVELFRSLGGGWENYQALPPIHRPEPAIIAMFQRTLSRSDPLK